MFMDLIAKRRSIRKYQNKPVEPEKAALLLEAALRSPSSVGSTPWEFILVTDRALLEKLSASKKFGSAPLKGAPLAIVVCADPSRSTVWVEDASVASTFILLAAESLGLGACWIQIRNRQHSESKTSHAYVSELLEIPEGIQVVSIVAVGYPAETKAAHSKGELQFEKCFLDVYGRCHQ